MNRPNLWAGEEDRVPKGELDQITFITHTHTHTHTQTQNNETY
jgi:hypothetical protein